MNKCRSRLIPQAILVLGAVFLGTAQAQQSVATSSSSAIWKNSPGECWQAADGSPAWCGEIPDSDGDGVTDDKDQCPDTPAGSEVGADGCLVDTDRDGVPDIADQCPDTALGIRVDTRGCDLDLDLDGVPYYADQCWDTPQGVRVDARGCPLSAVLFGFDKATLSLEARRILSHIAASVDKRSGITRITVTGHTDSIGGKAYNRKLARARAEAVRKYLVYRGVASSIIAVEKGESQPVADNRSAAGRAQNRRVEIVIE